MRRMVPCLVVAALLSSAIDGNAQGAETVLIESGGSPIIKNDAAIITTAAIGIAGAVATSIAALVYAIEERTFEGPWIIAALISAAICGSITVAHFSDGIENGLGAGHIMGIAFFGTITIAPTYWTIRTALAPEGAEFVSRPVNAPSRSLATVRTPASHIARVGFAF